ncbi:SAM-dependent methyltransferase [Actinocatenispora comari]|uniref:Methyltransferase domain-containing protein n=1 Tax=Actinocatenispora comari TaxID=2807577 RepID=A0A8J4AIY3_9ACTN|nr:methyltransferase domain-containing protein [Actinocatenispora comari]GIL32069.1 hypothetical protein NUM_73230 [Actinocatenispora comari]
MANRHDPELLATAFYDPVERGGEGASDLFRMLMGDDWSHGLREAEQQGKTPAEAAYALKQMLVDRAGIKPGHRVLEFGSGVGGGTVSMAQLTGASFLGISSSDYLTEQARAHASARGVSETVSFATVDPYEYRTLATWPRESFDAVCFFESLCHVPRKDLFMQAAFSRLKPGGVLYGLDWIQRPFAEFQTTEQIAPIIDPVCDQFRLAGIGTVDGYADLMRRAGLTVSAAVDEFAGVRCWGSTPDGDRPAWLQHARPLKQALDAARASGVFSVGWWIATKPGVLD